MEEQVRLFLQNPWIGLLGFLTGIMGLAIAVYSWRRNPQDKRVYFRSRGVNIVNKKSTDVSELQIRFAGADISTLSETMIHFWNGGNSAVVGSDIPDTSPMAVSVPEDAKILACAIVVVDGPGVQLTVGTDIGQHQLPIIINSIERRRGALLKVLHTCADPNKAVLSGSIRDHGAPRIRRPIVSASSISNTYLGALFLLPICLGVLAGVSQGIKSGLIGGILNGIFNVIIFLILLSLVIAPATKLLLWLIKQFTSPSSFEFQRDKFPEYPK